MPSKSPVAHFRDLADAASKRLAETFDAPDVIPYGAEALRLIAAHPSDRAAFAEAIVEGAATPENVDPWFLQFCVHGLRWPELRQSFEAKLVHATSRNDWNAIQHLSKLVAAFSDDWEDARDFYSAYFHPEAPNSSSKRTR